MERETSPVIFNDVRATNITRYMKRQAMAQHSASTQMFVQQSDAPAWTPCSSLAYLFYADVFLTQALENAELLHEDHSSSIVAHLLQ